MEQRTRLYGPTKIHEDPSIPCSRRIFTVDDALRVASSTRVRRGEGKNIPRPPWGTGLKPIFLIDFPRSHCSSAYWRRQSGRSCRAYELEEEDNCPEDTSSLLVIICTLLGDEP